jgi:hypothetical protein
LHSQTERSRVPETEKAREPLALAGGGIAPFVSRFDIVLLAPFQKQWLDQVG